MKEVSPSFDLAVYQTRYLNFLKTLGILKVMPRDFVYPTFKKAMGFK